MRKFQIKINDGEVRGISPDMGGGTIALSLDDESSLVLDNKTIERVLACWETEKLRRIVPAPMFTECQRCHCTTVDEDGACILCDD